MKQLPDYSDRTFLLVDDDEFMLSTIEKMLRQCHAKKIYRMTSAREVMNLAHDENVRFDCVISDCDMPEINGLQLLQSIRSGMIPAMPRSQNFIMLTGHGEVDLVKTALMLDVNGYLVKPVSLTKLTASIKHSIDHPPRLKTNDSLYKLIPVPKGRSES